ncbi:methane/ammonia monooxygenase subunit C [Methylomarinovum tepidoasis]|uniref:Methane/ammonia monooxygenase subunit C n=1 Tax=Methylomarinovum tepidoasis TaxID=2840183 RepID=A0AAU9CGH5_9GAMM|nr:bacterial ammonia monooxygenase, subunit AmoC [Methylomarinovum sp. IN45]BCX89333.1 methane/ammonia monooxygenase subunit C [Methylomarinovum sp. IN45]
MAATSAGVSAQAEAPLLNTRWLAFAFAIYTILYSWVVWYERVYGWQAGLDSFAPEFETYWMNFLYTEIVVEVVIASLLWGYLWRTRPRDLDKIAGTREELRRNFTHLVWLFAYAYSIYWGASFFTEQDGTWHQTIVRDTDFTPSHIIEFYGSYPVYIITGFGAFIYAHTRLPYFDYTKKGLSLPYLISVVGPFMIVPNVGLNEWGHTFWFMEELFVAPLHYGFVFFGWFALGILGVWLQTLASILNLIGKPLCGEIYDAAVARIGADQAQWADDVLED